MATIRESLRPLFHRFQNREAVNFRASEGKRLNNNVNTPAFAGELALNNPLGTYWPNFAQAGALVITVGEDAEVGGNDRVKITADGNTITLDPAYTWKNIGSDSIGVVAGNVNILMVNMVSATEIEYAVKLN